MAMSEQIMNINTLIGGLYEEGLPLKTEDLESQSDSNGFGSMAGFANTDFEVESWSKLSSMPFHLGTPDWYVTSIPRDSDSPTSAVASGTKQITIRLPLHARPCQLNGGSSKLADDKSELKPSCITPTSAEVNGAGTICVKTEKPDERLDCPFARWSNVCRDRVSEEKKSSSTSVKPREPLNEDTDVKVQLEGQSTEKVRRTRKPRTYKYDPKPLKKKECKRKIPEELKDEEYYANRKRNNEAAKKSRQNRRMKELELIEKMHNLKTENLRLKQQVEKLSKSNADYERKLAIV